MSGRIYFGQTYFAGDGSRPTVTITIGVASEVDTASTLTPAKSLAINPAVDGDQALPLQAVKARDINAASEVDSAGAFGVERITRSSGAGKLTPITPQHRRRPIPRRELAIHPAVERDHAGPAIARMHGTSTEEQELLVLALI